MTESRTRPFRPLPDSEPVTDPARVARLLTQLANRHELITVEILGKQGRYTSAVVSVDKQHVLLDELLPSDGNQALLKARTLQASGKLDGIDICFVTTLESVDKQDEVITLHAQLPRQLDYRQRRQDHRAHIPLAKTLRVILDSPDGRLKEGILHDLSRGGAGMLFAVDEIAVESERLQECAMQLPDNEWLYCSIELRHSKDLPSGDRQLIGTRFVGLTPGQARRVGHCVSELERELIRRRTLD